MVVAGCAGKRITFDDFCVGCSSGDSKRRLWQLVLGLTVTLVCYFGVGTKCRWFLRRQLGGVRTKYERGESVCLITVPLVFVMVCQCKCIERHNYTQSKRSGLEDDETRCRSLLSLSPQVIIITWFVQYFWSRIRYVWMRNESDNPTTHMSGQDDTFHGGSYGWIRRFRDS